MKDNRDDGKNCLLFTHQQNNLQENKVVQLAKGNANNLFIEYGSNGFQLTTNGKVDVMNARTQEVKSLTAAFPNLPFKEQDVYWISNEVRMKLIFLQRILSGFTFSTIIAFIILVKQYQEVSSD